MKTKNDLKKQIEAYSHRGDLSDQIDIFIMSAESRINRLLRVSLMEKMVTTTTPSSLVKVPADFLELRNFEVDGRAASMTTLPVLDRDRDSQKLQIALSGSHFELRPTIYPENPVGIKINYYAKIPTLIGTTSENELLENYPFLYLYACMLEASLFTQDDNRISVWKSAFEFEIEQSNDQDLYRNYSGAVMSVTSH